MKPTTTNSTNSTNSTMFTMWALFLFAVSTSHHAVCGFVPIPIAQLPNLQPQHFPLTSQSIFPREYLTNSSPTSSLLAQQKNEIQASTPSRSPQKMALLVTLALASGLAFWKRQALLTFIGYVKNEWLVTVLDRLNAAGPIGFVIYILAFLVWEMTLGITTPIEAAAGMAFGAVPGIVANGIAKTTGAFLTFLLARYVFADRVEKQVKNNELLGLMEESIQETPFRVALLCRFSPLPEVVKNAGMGVLPVPRRWFLTSILLHGFSFTCLWTCMGAESARVLRGLPPSSSLKYLMTGATWIGFGAPVLIGMWIKSLKDKQRERHERETTEATGVAAPASDSASE